MGSKRMGSKMKILLVDDNNDTLWLMKRALQKDEYSILLAKSGIEAITITEEERPDLILLDVMMPKLNGFETCEKILSEEKNKNIPIIMVTAKSDIEDLTRGLEAGAMDYIRKPFHNLELSARVKSALKLKKTTDDLVREKQKTAIMEMAAAVAHNLNQPLSGIMLNIQYIQSLMTQQNIKSETISERLDTLISIVERMSGMIKKISRITNYYTMPYVKDIKIVDIDKSSL